MFDAIVVLVALCLDAVYLHADDARIGTGLIIILRIWRVVRIQNGQCEEGPWDSRALAYTRVLGCFRFSRFSKFAHFGGKIMK